MKGFNQKGIDFKKIFSPLVKMLSKWVVLGLDASMDLEIEQLDLKTAFLHGDLKEEIYMEQPEEFQFQGKERLNCLLWYKKFNSFMIEHYYRRKTLDHCVFVKRFSKRVHHASSVC